MRLVALSLFAALLGAVLLPAHGNAQSPDPANKDFNQSYEAKVASARGECKRLWANHAFDSLRTRLPLGEDKPTFAMLKSTERLKAKEKPLADLAISTFEQCRKAFELVNAMLPPQIQDLIGGIQRRQDSKVAELYNGKITFGDFNVAMNDMSAELSAAFSGVVRQPKADTAAKPSSAVTRQIPSSPDLAKKSAEPASVRMALIIGNSNYTNLPKLSNPSRDAKSVAETLAAMGYKTRILLDGTEQIIRREIRQFAGDSEKADVALVFYAGHGAQVSGNNYLLPTDIDIPRTEVDIQFSGLKVDDLINSIHSSTKIVFLDACRDNPVLFKNLVKGRGASPTGLAPAAGSNFEQKPGGGIFIAYATDAGAVADDGSGQHSPFTQALLRNMQKPISIDDMFSLVTKEVRLVTKNAQRPYKYASLENIICLSPSCSKVSNPVPVDLLQQAQRSETEELDVAKSSNKLAALETFLEKYPETARRAEIENLIGNMRRAEFDEWVLVAVSNNRMPWYARLNSVQRFPDRVAITVRYSIDPASNKTFFGRPLPDAEYAEEINAYSCEKPAVSTSEQTIFDKSGTTLYHYKFADPQFLNLSSGPGLANGSIGSAIQSIACRRDLELPMVSKNQLAKMSFKSLSSTTAGDGELFYEPLPADEDKASNEKQLIFVSRLYDNKKVPLVVTSAEGPPNYRTEVDRIELLCTEKKLTATQSEYYDESSKLVYLTAASPNATKNWIELKDGIQSPLHTLYRIFCSAGEATK